MKWSRDLHYPRGVLSPQRKNRASRLCLLHPLGRDDDDETEDASGVPESEPGQRHHFEHGMQDVAEERRHCHDRHPAEAVHHQKVGVGRRSYRRTCQWAASKSN